MKTFQGKHIIIVKISFLCYPNNKMIALTIFHYKISLNVHKYISTSTFSSVIFGNK